jgi:hypothetical protein
LKEASPKSSPEERTCKRRVLNLYFIFIKITLKTVIIIFIPVLKVLSFGEDLGEVF